MVLLIQTKIWGILGTFYFKFYIFCYHEAFELLVSFPFCFAWLLNSKLTGNHCHNFYGSCTEFILTCCHHAHGSFSFYRLQSNGNNLSIKILICFKHKILFFVFKFYYYSLLGLKLYFYCKGRIFLLCCKQTNALIFQLDLYHVFLFCIFAI